MRKTPKVMIALRVKPAVLQYFKRGGKGYQSRMNAALEKVAKVKQ